MKENVYDSFEIIEDYNDKQKIINDKKTNNNNKTHKKDNKEKEKEKEKKNKPKKEEKNKEKNKEKEKDNNKDNIFIYDEKGNKNQIVEDYFLGKKNNNADKKEKKDKKEEKKKNNDDFGFTSKYFRIEGDEEDNEDNTVLRRSSSFNINTGTSTIIFVKTFHNKNNDNNKDVSGFEDLFEEKDNPEPFNASCIYYDKKNNSFNGKLTVDKKFKCSFELDKKSKKDLYYNKNYYTFSLLEINNYNKVTNYYFWKDTCIEIILKDQRYFTFDLKSSYKDFMDILDTFALPQQSKYFYKNAYFRFNHTKKKYDCNGWEIYDCEKEFTRQKIDFEYTYIKLDNSNFSLCPSYPEKIIVPKMDIEDIKKCANFRTKKRLPTLTYRHKNGCCIWRSSQTKSGFSGKNKQDEIFMTKITEGTKKIKVYDARPKLNAMANKLKGAGYENPSNYSEINMDITFCGIPNIHAVRSSFEKMLSSISFSNEGEYNVISNIPNTSWYETIILILKSSFQIYGSILDNWPVLIHCSDGWDRTSQLSCTSQLLLDKYYRTLEGFIVLIEKDWLSFGHQFRYRNGFYTSFENDVGTENQFSPIFIQWLDAVYQLMSQNYSKFEFNLNLLTFIASEVYTGKYGTFLFNNEKEREKNNAKSKTISIWSEVIKEKKYYLNPIYDPNNNEPMCINYKKIKLWDEYFYRFEKGEQKQLYLKLFNKKMCEKENTLDKKQKIIEEMVKFFLSQTEYDLSSFSEGCKNEFKKYTEKSIIKSNEKNTEKTNIQSNNYDMSFEILNPTPSILNMKK